MRSLLKLVGFVLPGPSLLQALIGAAVLPACMDLPPLSPGAAPAASPSQLPADVARAVDGLTNPTLTTYFATGDGGIAHVSYWDIKVGSARPSKPCPRRAEQAAQAARPVCCTVAACAWPGHPESRSPAHCRSARARRSASRRSC